MDWKYWLPLLLAIPLSIGANLLTPKIIRWWDQHRKRLSTKRRESLSKELKLVREFKEEPIQLVIYLVFQVLRVATLGCAFTLCSMAMLSLPREGSFNEHSLVFVTGAIYFIGSFIVTYWLGRARRLVRNVRKFEKFDADIRALISKGEGTDQNVVE